MGLFQRLQHGWNAFIARDPTPHYNLGPESYIRPGRMRIKRGNERSIISNTFNRIAVDVAKHRVEHCRLDQDGRYMEPIKSDLNECLTMQANIDQTARQFLQDCAMSLLDEGAIAIVPVDTTENPRLTGGFDIQSLRVGKVIGWYPRDVKVELYNDRTGKTEPVTLPKSVVALPENPFYSIMNEPNSFYQQLVRKIRQLDVIDDESASGKANLIVQLPYTIQSERRRTQADNRVKDFESQLSTSKYGIAYIDGTEKVTQLNRAIENNLFTQVEYYTKMFHAQLGMPEAVFDGSADETVMQNYMNRTIEPVISAIINAMKCKFLTKTARTQGQTIMYFTDPFVSTPQTQLGDLLEKLTRGEIITKNEARGIIGLPPIMDERADELSNPQLYDQGQTPVPEGEMPPSEEGEVEEPVEEEVEYEQ